MQLAHIDSFAVTRIQCAGQPKRMLSPARHSAATREWNRAIHDITQRQKWGNHKIKGEIAAGRWRQRGSTRLVSPPCGFRTRAAAGTASITASLLQPLLRAESQLAVELGAGIFAMNEIAKSSTDTSFSTIETTTRFSKICDR